MVAATEVGRFLNEVITTDEPGWLCLLIGPPFREEWYEWPSQADRIAERASTLAREVNVYFSPHLFSQKDSHKEFVLPSRTVAADLDTADVADAPTTPSFLVETSPGRHQAYWILSEAVSVEELEELSRRVTYSIPMCDRSGWPIGHKFRVPDTVNYKYENTPSVRLVDISRRSYTPYDLREATPAPPPRAKGEADDSWVATAHTIVLEEGPNSLVERYRKALGRAARYLNNAGTGAEGRSGALWALTRGLFRAGASRDEVFWVAKHSVNNKFKDSKYHADEDLAKDVLRAESYSTAERTDDRAFIMQLLVAPGVLIEKRMAIAQVVLDRMNRDGELVVTDENRPFFLRHDTGRPIALARRSEYLDAYLEQKFGLNSSEQNTVFVTQSVINTTLSRGRSVRAASLSHYDVATNTMLLHGGRRDVWAITRDRVEKIRNGQYGVMFLYRQGDQPFDVESAPPIVGQDWASFVFEGFFDNLLDMSREDVVALMRVWFIFVLMREAAQARPILALFGQPGSGKSTTFKLLYALMYGPRKSLNAVTSADNFDHLVSSDPLVVFDNVDTWASWLPDRLALSAATSDLVKRRLYSDADTVTLRRQAVVGISAHNPRFGREDVVDRLLLINFRRLVTFKDERSMFERVLRNRNSIWASIVQDIQKVLQQPIPRPEDVPQFRIADFATIGLRIARAIGVEESFRRVINDTYKAQVAFNLSEDDLLVDVIGRWLARRPADDGTYFHVARLHEAWSLIDDSFVRHYRSPVLLGKKLWTMYETLKTVFNVEYVYDSSRGVRQWRFGRKQDA